MKGGRGDQSVSFLEYAVSQYLALSSRSDATPLTKQSDDVRESGYVIMISLDSPSQAALAISTYPRPHCTSDTIMLSSSLVVPRCARMVAGCSPHVFKVRGPPLAQYFSHPFPFVFDILLQLCLKPNSQPARSLGKIFDTGRNSRSQGLRPVS